jgi:hypothetical protein
MIHQLTPRRKSDALATQKKLVSVSPEADSTDDGAGAADDGSSTSSSRSSNRQTSSSALATTTTTTTTLDRASIIASLRPNTKTEGLSDYELLRLQKIQRNEAKLASLGLCGITSKNHNNNKTSGIGGGGTTISNESSAKKAANTRRKNAAHAKKIMQLHHEQQRTTHTSSYRFISYQSTTATAIPNPNSRIEQWKSRYSELQSFIATYGTYDILTRSFENGKYKSLCGWWNRQRTQHTKYKFGSKSTLGEEQIRLLDNLNDHWRSSSSSSSSSATRGVGDGREGGDGRGGGGDGGV